MSFRSRSRSTSSNESCLGDWDQPGNIVDTLGLQPAPVISDAERKLKAQFSFDVHKEFSDVRIYSMQNRRRFSNLFELLKFPCQPIFSSIFCIFNFKLYRYKPERFLQRRLCLDICNWNPGPCFLEDNHSRNLKDLMSKEFHQLYNPEFVARFKTEMKTIYKQFVSSKC